MNFPIFHPNFTRFFSWLPVSIPLNIVTTQWAWSWNVFEHILNHQPWLSFPARNSPKRGNSVIWRFPEMGGTPKSSILMRIFHYKPSSYGGVPPFMETAICTRVILLRHGRWSLWQSGMGLTLVSSCGSSKSHCSKQQRHVKGIKDWYLCESPSFCC